MKLSNKTSRLRIYAFSLVLILTCGSCSKLVEVDPPVTSTNGEIVYNDDATAIGVLTGIYTNMSQANIATGVGRLTNICFTTGLTGDELELFDKTNNYFGQFYFNKVNPLDGSWQDLYKMLYVANSAIEKLPQSDKLTPSVRSQLLGEAHFIRALTNFYLVNLYGRIPMPVTSDYAVNRLLPRRAENEVYELVVSDLQVAKGILSDDFLAKNAIATTLERVRPTKWVAIALLARVYLYGGKYAEAEMEANLVIENKTLFDLVELRQTFLKNNKEAIWQLQPVGQDLRSNTPEGQIFNLLPVGGPGDSNPVFLTQDLVGSFEEADQRKAEWIRSITRDGYNFSYPYKYRIGLEFSTTEEYSTVFRIAEQYLIRAEAKIRQGKTSEGLKDLNVLRERATDPDNSHEQLAKLSESMGQPEALIALESERRHELFTEWGHRWLDLKRTGRIGEVLSKIKTGWQSTDALFPIPQADIVGGNPNMKGDQNPGY